VAEIEKSGGAATVKVSVAECARLPLVPVRVNVELPSGVVELVVTVSVAPWPPVADAGLKVAVVPVGNPLALRAIVPVKPLRALVVIG